MRIVYILAAVVLAISLSGCSFGSTDAGQNTSQNTTQYETLYVKTTHSSAEGTENAGGAKQSSDVTEKYRQIVQPAVSAMEAGNYDQAIQLATDVIKDNKNNDQAYSVKGLALALEGKTQEGLALTKEAFSLNPDNVANFYNMAMIYKLEGNLPGAKTWFEKVLAVDPNNTWSVYGISTIYSDQGNDSEALAWLKRAIDLDPVVKDAARVQDHFERFSNNEAFQKLVK